MPLFMFLLALMPKVPLATHGYLDAEFFSGFHDYRIILGSAGLNYVFDTGLCEDMQDIVEGKERIA